MTKRYWIVCAFAILFLACVFIPPAQAKPVHEEDVKPCIVVEPWMPVTVTKPFASGESVPNKIFVERSGNYSFTYKGYIPKVKSIPTSNNGHIVTYHGLIPLAPGQI